MTSRKRFAIFYEIETPDPKNLSRRPENNIYSAYGYGL